MTEDTTATEAPEEEALEETAGEELERLRAKRDAQAAEQGVHPGQVRESRADFMARRQAEIAVAKETAVAKRDEATAARTDQRKRELAGHARHQEGNAEALDVTARAQASLRQGGGGRERLAPPTEALENMTKGTLEAMAERELEGGLASVERLDGRTDLEPRIKDLVAALKA